MKEILRVAKQIGKVLFFASLPFFPLMCITLPVAFLLGLTERSVTLDN
jgi:hypothetical protein